MSEASDEEFFVGYLSIPARTKRFVLGIAAALSVLLLALAALAAALRDAPASTTLAKVTLTGKLDARAYGVLWTVQDDRPMPDPDRRRWQVRRARCCQTAVRAERRGPRAAPGA